MNFHSFNWDCWGEEDFIEVHCSSQSHARDRKINWARSWALKEFVVSAFSIFAFQLSTDVALSSISKREKTLWKQHPHSSEAHTVHDTVMITYPPAGSWMLISIDALIKDLHRLAYLAHHNFVSQPFHAQNSSKGFQRFQSALMQIMFRLQLFINATI